MHSPARRSFLALGIVLLALGGALPALSQAVFINEIHYDNNGTDTGEAIEVAGPAGTNLSGWTLVLYNGTGGAPYTTTNLSGTIPDQSGTGYGTLSFGYPSNGIQNGAPDGMALANGATLVQFLCYEGTFAALGGVADGVTCTDIGVFEAGTEAAGQSLRLSGSGTTYTNFTWNAPATASFGSINAGQTFGAGDAAPTVQSTTPTNGATGVALDADISITFSEAVNVTGSWYTIACATSGSHTAAVTGGPTTFTLNPNVNFGNGESCTVTVLAASVTDQDANDPPDAMAANYTWSFSTPALVEPVLLISEYVEGSSNNKAIEIFNATPSTVDLGAQGYRVELYFNGAAAAGQTISLTGTLAPGDVYVLAHSSASPTILTVADQTSSNLTFNGDDALVLRRGAGGPVIDSLGQVGTDPGTEWGTGLTSTSDNTIRRKPTVCAGDLIINDAFDPATEWDGFAIDTLDGLGLHVHSCAGVPNPLRATGAASPASVLAGGTSLLTVTVVPATLPSSSGLAVVGNLTAIGGSATQTFFDNGTNGDAIAGDLVFSFSATVAAGTTIGTKSLPTTTTDAQARSAVAPISLGVKPPPTAIHDIQGSGATSPFVGTVVSTTGVVTGVKADGFFIQERDEDVVGPPGTSSEGILVYTNGANPAEAIVGNRLEVLGTVSEYVPSADPQQPPVTELGSPSVTLLSSGNALPTSVVLTATLPDPAGSYGQLEKYEGMRVTVPSMTVVGPTLGSTNEPNATATSTGVFYGVVTAVARPFREKGIRAPDVPPAGSIPPIPQWNGNPELIRVDSDGLTGTAAINVATGAIITDVTGPLDYTFRYYTILPQATLVPTGGMTATPVAAPTDSEFTIASYNLERFYDNVDDAGVSDVALTPVAYANRLAKASLGIRDYLKTPDILGVVEVENLTVLQALAGKINADAVAASQPDPQYVGYLVDGNDIGGIDVGFLVKTAFAYGTTPRVSVDPITPVVQELKDTLFVNPDASTELLNDRPPLRLNAVINVANGASFPVTVIVNHLKAMTGVDDPAAGSNGWTTKGARDRAKRQKQAEDLAALVQARQVANPGERIVLVGDFNGYEFNDGYVDMLNVIAGTPTPDNETVVPGDGIDLVTPDFVNLVTSAPATERYSYVYDGSAQSIDHVLVNVPFVSGTLARRVEHPRINADFPETDRSVYGGTAVTRLSDHEPIVSYYQVAAFASADLSTTLTDTPDPVTAGTNLAYTITVTNSGPDAAATASFSDTLPAGTTFVSLPAVAGWACTTPAVGAAGTVSCSNASFAVGSAAFTLTVAVSPATANGTILSNTVTVTSAAGDGTPANNTATATTTVNALADLAVTMTANPAATAPGGTFTHSANVTNLGPSTATGVTLTLTLPAGTVAGTITPGACVAVSSTVTCTIGSLAMGGTFAASVEMTAATTGSYATTGLVAGAATDPNPANDTASATTAVGQIVATPNPVNMRVPVFSLGSKILNITNDSPLTVGFSLLERPIEYAWARFLSAGPTWKVPAEHASDRTARAVPEHPLAATPVSPLASIADLDFPVGLVYPWGIGFNTMADDMWVNDIAAAGGDGLNHRFLAAGTATGDTINISSWVGSFAADMTYDPFANRLWQVNVGGDNCIHELDPSAKVSTGNAICPAFGTSQRGLAFDPVSDTFFAGSWNDGVIHRFDRNGDILESFSAGLDVSGLAYNPGSGHLFVLTNTDAAADLYVLDVNNAYATVSSFKVAGMAAFDQAGLEADCAGNLYAVNQATAEVLVVPSGETGFCSFSTVPWLDETPKSGTLAPGATQPVTLDFITALQWPGLHQASLRVAGTDPFAPVDVPVNYTIAFLDVPVDHWADAFIHALAGVRVSRGCGEGNFCPEAEVDRAEMAILMVRAMHGPLFVPPAATGVFVDVPISETDVTADYIEQLYRDGVVAGCAVGGDGERYYCPDRLVSRAEMSVFVSVGVGLPPVNPPTGYFSDVHGTGYSWAEGFIETIFNEGITAGCGDHVFCPATTITRAQLAVWLVVGFNFPYLPPTP